MFEPRYLSCGQSKAPSALHQIACLNLGVEVQFESAEDLWPQLRWENLLDLADHISDLNLNASVHAPFHSLNLGSADSHIREYSLEVLSLALEVARAFHSPHIIIHSGFNPQYSQKARDKWLDVFSASFEALLSRAAELHVRVALENTYERDPSLFEEIFTRFPTPLLGMCFDIGHASCFGKVDPIVWPKTFLDRMIHIHCSDNDCRDDLHLGLGAGIVDFRSVLAAMAGMGLDCSMTMEVPIADAQASRDYLLHLVSMLSTKESQ